MDIGRKWYHNKEIFKQENHSLWGFEIEEEGEYIIMYFSLLKEGRPVEFLAPFDDMVIAFLAEWDPALGYGKYGVTVEVEDEEACKNTVQCALDYLYDAYKGK